MSVHPPAPERPLLLLDYDGTLAPIVEDPAKAHPHQGVPTLLQHLAERHPLYVVSGRDIASLGRLLADAEGKPLAVAAIGLHGAERGILGRPAPRPSIDDHEGALSVMRSRVPSMEGVDVEEKGGAAFAVHYRRSPDPPRAREALHRWAAAVPPQLEAVWGKMVVELRARGISKGASVAEIAAGHPDRVPVYMGDDVTDEEAFAALNAMAPNAVTIKVGAGSTGARYRVAGVDEAIAYLSGFVR